MLITGSCGFLGRYLCHEFSDCDVTTLGLNPNNNIVCDLSINVPKFSRGFDLVVHAAGDPRNEKADAVNHFGTINLCKGLEADPPREFVFISSVQVYGKTKGEDYDESEPIEPFTEYGKSKAKAEEFLKQWCCERGVKLSIIRPPLIVGTRMKGTLRSMVNGIYRGYYFHFKNNSARRSVVHAVDVSHVVRLISPIGGIFNVTDGAHPSVYDLAEAFAYRMGNRRIYTIPMWMARLAAKCGDVVGYNNSPITTVKLSHLTDTLTFNSDAISKVIDWTPNVVTNYLRTHNYDENSL
ncbi:MAG: NAD-dependent epimerase/dehydratase family protein [Muribaculaceae bacterium]|nr:NAD-dependent epimerase/dehydratase family protein [Muribaculaceae bacterium]